MYGTANAERPPPQAGEGNCPDSPASGEGKARRLLFRLCPEECPGVHYAFELGDGPGDGIDLPQLAFTGLRDVEPLAIRAHPHRVGLPGIEVAGTHLEGRRVDSDDAHIRKGVEGATVGGRSTPPAIGWWRGSAWMKGPPSRMYTVYT